MTNKDYDRWIEQLRDQPMTTWDKVHVVYLVLTISLLGLLFMKHFLYWLASVPL